ncbi:acyl-CoA dehydrogenase family protein [Symbiobacterium thermophilum]|uniref:Acyl-CoA dehydrogenase n=1 Tax=Symbiobacterium thermophilum TaxID=2734 RepID=A0A953I2Z8_SYMTR|nr:acyl-CoA dehydrogenase family protein [Symbiobacterium thermophilum]MBY6276046.1 acyl-CoA dehydrogenase [Symbiobacterium thermophilum]
MLDMSLTASQQEWRTKVRNFVEKFVIPNAAEYDRTGEFPQKIIEEAGKAGLLDFAVPKEYGGPGLDSLTVSIIQEELGRGCVAIQTTIGGNGLSAYPVLFGGTEEQKKKYFQFILDKKITAFALTEPGAGSDAASVQTTAVLDGNEYILNGTKCFCTNGAYASVMTVIASTDPAKGVKGLSAFIVETDREGITIGKKEEKMGIRASNTVEVIFNNVRIPKENLIGEEGKGFKLAMMTLDAARLSVASAALGLSKRVLEETIRFVKEERKGGRPIVSSQYVQFKLADMAMLIEASENLIHKTCYLKDSGKRYSKESAMAKAFATDVAMKVAAMAVDLFGPYGYLKESVVEKLMRDVKVMQIYEGTNQIQRIVIANNLIRN